MKKVLSLVAIAGLVAFYACGPSAEEKAAAEKVKQDSIAAVDAANKAAEEAAKQQAMEAAKADSIAKADSLAKVEAAGKKGKK